MSEWTPLACGQCGGPRKWSQEPGWLNAVHCISLDDNYSTADFGSIVVFDGQTASFHLIDDPAHFCQARPMSVVWTHPDIWATGWYGINPVLWFGSAPEVGEITLTLSPTKERDTGVYMRYRRTIGTTAVAVPGGSTTYTYGRHYEADRLSRNPPPLLPLEEWIQQNDSRVYHWLIGCGEVSEYYELEYGIIGQSPAGTLSMESVIRLGLPSLELGVYQPPGSSEAIAVVGEINRPYGLSRTFAAPCSFTATGEKFPRSYAGLQVRAFSGEYAIERPVSYDAEAGSFTATSSKLLIEPYRLFRRSIEFDNGPAMRAGASNNYSRRAAEPSEKGAGNHASAGEEYSMAPEITDQHRKQNTEGRFGWPVTPSQCQFPAIGASYNSGVSFRAECGVSTRGYVVAVSGHTFELGKQDERGVDLFPNTAFGKNDNVDTVAFVAPSEEFLMYNPPQVRPGGVEAWRRLWYGVKTSETSSLIAAYIAAADDQKKVMEWSGTGHCDFGDRFPPGGGARIGYNMMRIGNGIGWIRNSDDSGYICDNRGTLREQRTTTRTKCRAYFSCVHEYINPWANPAPPGTVTFTEGDDFPIATSGGISAHEQGVVVSVKRDGARLLVEGTANVEDRENITKRVMWFCDGLYAGTPYNIGQSGLSGTTQDERADIFCTSLRPVTKEVDEPFSYGYESLSFRGFLSEADELELYSTGSVTVNSTGFWAGEDGYGHGWINFTTGGFNNSSYGSDYSRYNYERYGDEIANDNPSNVIYLTLTMS